MSAAEPVVFEQDPAKSALPGLLRRLPVMLLLCMALCADLVLAGGHDRQRLVELGLFAVGAALALVLARRADWPRTVFAGAAGKLLAAFFALGVLGSASAFSTRYALFEVAAFLMLYLLALMGASGIARTGTGGLVLALRIVGGVCTLYAFGFLVAYAGSFQLHMPIDFDDLTSGFSNVRFFNHVQTPTLPLLVLLCCLERRTARWRWVWWGAAAYWWMVLFATTGRGTLVGTAIACAAVAVLLRRAALDYLKTLLATALLGLMAYFVLLVALPSLAGIEGMRSFSYAAERTAADPASGRLFLWRRAVELIVQHPLLGVGPMHFAHYGADLRMAAHPHDWLLQIGSEWGLPALACLGGAVALGLRALLGAASRIQPGDATGRTILAAMLAAAVAILVDGLVSGLFVMPASRLVIAIYLACAIGWYRGLAPPAPAAAPGGLARSGVVVLVLVALAGTAAIWPEALQRYRGEPAPAAQQALNSGVHWPRLWESGFF